MTLLDEMADYQHPPVMANQSMEKFKQKSDTEKLKSRLESYRARHCNMDVTSGPAMQALYQHSHEETKKYHEKWQQVKAKKSNKRQRDSTGTAAAGQLKRKLSNKADGPANKVPNVDTVGAQDDDNESDPLDLLIDLDLEQLSAGNNINEIMTMLESDSSTASNSEHVNSMYSNPVHSQLHGGNDRQPPPNQQQPVRQQTPKQQPHISNTPSPQLQQHNGVGGGILSQQQAYLGPAGIPANRQMPPTVYQPQQIKSERMAAAPYARSISESTALYDIQQRQHAHQMERQPSMPADYARAFPGPQFVKVPQMAGGVLQGVSMAHEYPPHQMSAAHNPQTAGIPGAYYPNQMPIASSASREYPHGGATVPGYHGYASSQFVHPNMQMTPEMARSHVHSGIMAGGGHYMDPRSVQPANYHSMMAGSQSAAAMQHQAAALRANSIHHTHPEHQMVPGSGAQYMAGYGPAGMPSGGAKPPHLSRQLSVHSQGAGLLTHESQHLTTSKSVSNMQHTGGAMSHPAFQTSQPTMLGVSAGSSYPQAPSHARMGPVSVNPTMMSRPQQHSSAQLQSQHHMSRAQANIPAGVGQNQMMTATHPSVNPHMMHRPPSTGAHQHNIVRPHATSPPQTAVTPLPSNHYAMAQHQQAIQQHAHQRTLSHMQQQHSNIHAQHLQRQSMSLPQQNQTPHPQQQQHTPNQDLQQNHTQQFQDDLNDLNELIFSGTQAI